KLVQLLKICSKSHSITHLSPLTGSAHYQPTFSICSPGHVCQFGGRCPRRNPIRNAYFSQGSSGKDVLDVGSSMDSNVYNWPSLLLPRLDGQFDEMTEESKDRSNLRLDLPGCNCAHLDCLNAWPETICASDGLTYSNSCFMQRAACQQQRELRLLYRGNCQ
ncbi:unnamed protein product, partial [Protopolystoma xenopodis]